MKFLVVTRDGNFTKLSREVLTALGGRSWTLATCEPHENVPAADWYIWDFQPGVAFPADQDLLARHLFLVDSHDLQSFREHLQAREVNILLKPVPRAVLSTYLALALNLYQDCVSRNDSLRADRDEMLQSLMVANLRLQEYDQERTNFLTRAVHDFRAPLTALSGYCGLLLSDALGELSSDQAEVIRRMQHSSDRLSRMANGMLRLGVVQSAQRPVDLQRADLQKCLDQATREIAPFARDKQISISAELAPAPGGLRFDPGLIEQLLLNLLDNGCKFTPRGGKIEIKGYPYFLNRRDKRQITPILEERRSRDSFEPNTYRVDISDSGTFIPQDQLERIFEEYTSAGGKYDRSGGGLGLAICRSIVGLHAGRIWAGNTETGPIVSFALPLHRDRYVNQENKRGSNLAVDHESEVVQ